VAKGFGAWRIVGLIWPLRIFMVLDQRLLVGLWIRPERPDLRSDFVRLVILEGLPHPRAAAQQLRAGGFDRK